MCSQIHNCFSVCLLPVSKESAGAIDEEDFIKAFTDVPTVTVPNPASLFTRPSRQVSLAHGFFRPLQIYSSRDLEDNLNKIREICSDDKHDWDQRANAVSAALAAPFVIFFFLHPSYTLPLFSFFPPRQLKKIRSLLVAGAPTYDCFFQHLRLLDGAFKLSAKDLRSQVVREACFTVA